MNPYDGPDPRFVRPSGECSDPKPADVQSGPGFAVWLPCPTCGAIHRDREAKAYTMILDDGTTRADLDAPIPFALAEVKP